MSDKKLNDSLPGETTDAIENAQSPENKEKSKKSILKSPVQLFFLCVGIVTLIGVIPWTYLIIIHTEKVIHEKPADYPFPKWSDFKWSLLAMIGFGIADAVLNFAFYHALLPLCKE